MLGSIVWDFVLNVIPESCSEDSSMQIQYIFSMSGRTSVIYHGVWKVLVTLTSFCLMNVYSQAVGISSM